MAKNHSILDDLLTLPWWFNLTLAAIVYAGLKYVLPGIEFQSPLFQGIGNALPQSAGIFAGILVFTAALSAYHAWRKGELLDRQTSVNSIKDLPWKDFEYLVSKAYKRQGYSVQENTGGGADGGIDLTLNKDRQKILVQCKNWKSKSVGVTTIRELFGVVTAEGASEGIVVCSGHYTKDAITFAAGKPLTLVDGNEIVRLIGSVQKAPKITPEVNSTECPVCHSSMVLRSAKKGKNVGASFWVVPDSRNVGALGIMLDWLCWESDSGHNVVDIPSTNTDIPLTPAPSSQLTAYPVSTWLNSPRNNDERCIQPAGL